MQVTCPEDIGEWLETLAPLAGGPPSMTELKSSGEICGVRFLSRARKRLSVRRAVPGAAARLVGHTGELDGARRASRRRWRRRRTSPPKDDSRVERSKAVSNLFQVGDALFLRPLGLGWTIVQPLVGSHVRRPCVGTTLALTGANAVSFSQSRCARVSCQTCDRSGNDCKHAGPGGNPFMIELGSDEGGPAPTLWRLKSLCPRIATTSGD